VSDEFDAAARRLRDQAAISPEEASAIGERFLAGDRARGPAPSGDRCPHGDDACPCQDRGDPCHYEGPSRGPRGMVELMVCPNPTDGLTDLTGVLNSANRTYPHCHLEGCGWTRPALGAGARDCGLLDRLGLAPPDLDERLDSLRGTPWWACGEARRAASS
jgi:hypothetical protein